MDLASTVANLELERRSLVIVAFQSYETFGHSQEGDCFGWGLEVITMDVAWCISLAFKADSGGLFQSSPCLHMSKTSQCLGKFSSQ